MSTTNSSRILIVVVFLLLFSIISHAQTSQQDIETMLQNGVKLLNTHYTKYAEPEMVYITYEFNFIDPKLYSYPFSFLFNLPNFKLQRNEKSTQSPQLQPAVVLSLHIDTLFNYTQSYDHIASVVHVVPLRSSTDGLSTYTQSIRFAHGLEEGVLNYEWYKTSLAYNKSRYFTIAFPLSEFNFESKPNFPYEYNIAFIFEIPPLEQQMYVHELSIGLNNINNSSSKMKIIKLDGNINDNDTTLTSTNQHYDEQHQYDRITQQSISSQQEPQQHHQQLIPLQSTPITITLSSSSLISDILILLQSTVEVKLKHKIDLHFELKRAGGNEPNIYTKIDTHFGYLGLIDPNGITCRAYDWVTEYDEDGDPYRTRITDPTFTFTLEKFNYISPTITIRSSLLTTIPRSKFITCQNGISQVLTPIFMDWRYDSNGVLNYDTINLPLPSTRYEKSIRTTSSQQFSQNQSPLNTIINKAYHRTWSYWKKNSKEFPSYRSMRIFNNNNEFLGVQQHKLPIETYYDSIKKSKLPLILGLTIGLSILVIIIILIILWCRWCNRNKKREAEENAKSKSTTSLTSQRKLQLKQENQQNQQQFQQNTPYEYNPPTTNNHVNQPQPQPDTRPYDYSNVVNTNNEYNYPGNNNDNTNIDKYNYQPNPDPIPPPYIEMQRNSAPVPAPYIEMQQNPQHN